MWEGERGIDRRSGMRWGESGDRQKEEWGGRRREWKSGRGE